MSIQVKRRREAASFLATFTGAQAELVVDTTNNRVQVHDGATPGGWPAAKLAETQTIGRTAISDANYAIQASDVLVCMTALTAARTLALPASSAFPPGRVLRVLDESGAASAGAQIIVAASGSDLIDGAQSVAIQSAYGALELIANGAGKWFKLSSLASVAPAAGDYSSNLITSAWFTQNTPGGLVNKFRNAGMDVWQRGTSPMNISTSGAYSADGWIVVPSGGSCGAQVGAGRWLTVNSLQVYGGAGVTDVVVKQRIESFIAAPLSGQAVTIQAQVYNNTGAAITPLLTVKHAGSADNWSSPVTDVSAVALQTCANQAWTRVAYSLYVSSSAAKGLEIGFDFGANFSAGARSIQLTEFDIRVTPGAPTGLDANPPPPELRPVATELALCQRYFATSYRQGLAPGTSGQTTAGVMRSPDAANSYMSFSTVRFPCVMRAAPSVTIYNPNTGATGSAYNFNASSSAAVALYDMNDSYFNAYVNNASVSPGNLVGFHFTASAEI